MPRSPDFLLGFGFSAKDKGLLKYLKDVKDSLVSVSEGFAAIKKTVKGVYGEKALATEELRSVWRSSGAEVYRTKSRHRYDPFQDHRSFVERVKEAVDPDPRKIKIAQMERVLNRLNKRYQETGERLKDLQYHTKNYIRELRRAKFEERYQKITDKLEDFGVSMLRFFGVKEGLEKFIFKVIPKGLSGVWQVLKKVTVGTYKWVHDRRKGIPSLKKRLFNALFIRKKEAATLAKGIQQVQKVAAAQAKKIDPIAATERRDKNRIAKIKAAFDTLNISGVLANAVRVGMKKSKDIIKKAKLPKALETEFRKARNKANNQLVLLEKHVRRATGKKGIQKSFRLSAIAIKKTLASLGKGFRNFALEAGNQFESIIPPMRNAVLSIQAEFDRMWSYLCTSGENAFTSVLSDKEQFVKKFVQNFRNLASQTEMQLGRLSTEANTQFLEMASAAKRAFDQMGEKFERSVSEAAKSARHSAYSSGQAILKEASKKERSVRGKGRVQMPDVSGDIEEAIQKLITSMRESLRVKVGKEVSPEFSRAVIKWSGEVVDAIENLNNALMDKLSDLEAAVVKSAKPKRELFDVGITKAKQPEAKAGSKMDTLMDIAGFIPQLRGLKVLKGLKR